MWQRDIYRASKLDEFAMYLSGELWNGDDYTPEEFIRRMTEREESPRMSAGTAFHKLIETAPDGALPDEATVDGWKICILAEGEVAYPRLREVPLTRRLDDITLFGRVDAIDATSVHDLKTTSSFDADRYAESWQWRAYLWMSGRDRFVYHLFRVDVDEVEMKMVVRDYAPLTFFRYSALDGEVERFLREFDFAVKALGIDRIMQEKIAA